MADDAAAASVADAPAAAPSAAVASATEALYRAALGPARLAHYLPVFARFDDLGLARPSWNHAAGWLNWHWLLYHRLWRQALLHIALLALALGAWWWLHLQFGPWPAGVRWGLLAAIGVLAVVAPGWWGDAWLHAEVRRRMTVAVRQARTVQEACDLLARPSIAGRLWLPVLLAEAALLVVLLKSGEAPQPPAPAPEPVVTERLATPEPAPGPATVSQPAAPPEPAVEPAVETARVVAPAASGAAAPEGASEPVVAPTPPTPATPATPPATAASEMAAAPAAPPRERLGGHGVAVGIFADPANAERALQKLRAAGLPAVSDPLESARGPLIRVRAGPFDTHEEAVAAAARVRALGLEARVFGPR